MDPPQKGVNTERQTRGLRDSRIEHADDCSVCLNPFDNVMRRPRNLPCGHTFCTLCINELKVERQVACPSCRVTHPIPEEGQFPISYTFENVLKLLRDVSPTSLPRTLEKDTEEPVSEQVTDISTGRGAKGSQNISKKVRIKLNKQETKILAAIQKWQKATEQLCEYETTVDGWIKKQQLLEDRVQSLIDNSKNAKALARKEDLSIEDRKRQLQEGREHLNAMLQAVRTAASGMEGHQAIEKVDRGLEKMRQTMEECLVMFPDVRTVTTITKALEVSDAALEAADIVQKAQETGDDTAAASGVTAVPVGAVGGSSLSVAPDDSISERVNILTSRTLKEEEILRPKQLVRDLLQKGRVFAIHKTEMGRRRLARISLEYGRLYIHPLQDKPLFFGAATVQIEELVVPAAPACTVFLELTWPGRAPRRVLVRVGLNNPLGKGFQKLCTGLRGPCYAGTKLWKVMNKGQLGECVWGGDPDYGEKKELVQVLQNNTDLYLISCKAGILCGRGWGWNHPLRCDQFCITTKKGQEGIMLPNVFGEVVDGLEVVMEAAQHHPITEVTVVDCGMML